MYEQSTDPTSKKEFKYGKEYNLVLDEILISYHLISYIGTLLRINAGEYIKTKKFFKGYIDDFEKTAAYIIGLEDGLNDYKQALDVSRFDFIVPVSSGENWDYQIRTTLDNLPIPYFNDVKHVQSDYEKVSLSFDTNLNLMLQPQILPKTGSIYGQNIKQLNTLSTVLLEHLFLD